MKSPIYIHIGLQSSRFVFRTTSRVYRADFGACRFACLLAWLASERAANAHASKQPFINISTV